MTLYLYRAGTAVPVLTLENVVSYTADAVTCADGSVYAPLAADCELSDTADCAGALRAAWRGAHTDPASDRDELLVDHEYRLTLLELGVAD